MKIARRPPCVIPATLCIVPASPGVIPASPGVIPAKAGIQSLRTTPHYKPWIPAFAGMTKGGNPTSKSSAPLDMQAQ